MLKAVASYANIIIAFFTVILVVTTVIYTLVTSKLLKEAKNAFLADMVVRFMEMHLEGWKELYLRNCKTEEAKEFMSKTITGAYIDAICGAFGVIDKKLGKKIDKIMAVGLQEAERAIKGTIKELKKDYEKGDSEKR